MTQLRFHLGYFAQFWLDILKAVQLNFEACSEDQGGGEKQQQNKTLQQLVSPFLIILSRKEKLKELDFCIPEKMIRAWIRLFFGGR